LREAKNRNPALTLDGAAWSAPGWIGNGKFWSQDAADYYVKWLAGLRNAYGLDFDSIGCRNEKGVSFEFAKMLRATLDANGFKKES
jgi:galactosylceramidase